MAIPNIYLGLSQSKVGGTILTSNARLTVYEGYGISHADNFIQIGEFYIDQDDDTFGLETNVIAISASNAIKKLNKKYSPGNLTYVGQERFQDSFNDGIYSDRWQANDLNFGEGSGSLNVVGPQTFSTVFLSEPAIWDDFSATFKVRSTIDIGKLGFAFRSNGEYPDAGATALPTGYLVELNYPGNQVLLSRQETGKSVSLGTQSFTLAANTDYWIRVQARNGRIIVLTSTNGASYSSAITANDGVYKEGSLGFVHSGLGGTVIYSIDQFEVYTLRPPLTIHELSKVLPLSAGITQIDTPYLWNVSNDVSTPWSTVDGAGASFTADAIQITAGASTTRPYSRLYTAGTTFNNFYCEFDIQGMSNAGIVNAVIGVGKTPTMAKQFVLNIGNSADRNYTELEYVTGSSRYRDIARNFDHRLDKAQWYTVGLLKKDDWMSLSVDGVLIASASDIGVSVMTGITPLPYRNDLNHGGETVFNHFMVGLLNQTTTTQSLQVRNMKFVAFYDDVGEFSIQPDNSYLSALDRLVERNNFMYRLTGNTLGFIQESVTPVAGISWHGVSNPLYSPVVITKSDDQGSNHQYLVGYANRSYSRFDTNNVNTVLQDRVEVVTDETVDTAREAQEVLTALQQYNKRRKTLGIDIPAQPYMQTYDILNFIHPRSGVSGNFRIVHLTKEYAGGAFKSHLEIIET